MKTFSFDAETNGLWGKAFSIAAVVAVDGKEINSFIGRCPIEGETNQWVEENVLPEMEDVEINYSSYEEMLKAFMAFYLEHKENARIVVHMGLPVESRLFIDAHALGIIGDWDAPYPLIDISAIPDINTSVDSYNKNNGLDVPFKGSCHNPLYDSWATLVAYEHWVKNNQTII